MNEPFNNPPNTEDEKIAHKLSQVAEHTHPSGQFSADLEKRLRSAPPPRTAWLTQVPPVLRWMALMALLALV